MSEGATTHVSDLGNCIIIVRGVPCLKCEQCGEIVYTGTVERRLEKIIGDMRKSLTEIAVINYSSVA